MTARPIGPSVTRRRCCGARTETEEWLLTMGLAPRAGGVGCASAPAMARLGGGRWRGRARWAWRRGRPCAAVTRRGGTDSGRTHLSALGVRTWWWIPRASRCRGGSGGRKRTDRRRESRAVADAVLGWRTGRVARGAGPVARGGGWPARESGLTTLQRDRTRLRTGSTGCWRYRGCGACGSTRACRRGWRRRGIGPARRCRADADADSGDLACLATVDASGGGRGGRTAAGRARRRRTGRRRSG